MQKFFYFGLSIDEQNRDAILHFRVQIDGGDDDEVTLRLWFGTVHVVQLHVHVLVTQKSVFDERFVSVPRVFFARKGIGQIHVHRRNFARPRRFFLRATRGEKCWAKTTLDWDFLPLVLFAPCR